MYLFLTPELFKFLLFDYLDQLYSAESSALRTVSGIWQMLSKQLMNVHKYLHFRDKQWSVKKLTCSIVPHQKKWGSWYSKTHLDSTEILSVLWQKIPRTYGTRKKIFGSRGLEELESALSQGCWKRENENTCNGNFNLIAKVGDQF